MCVLNCCINCNYDLLFTDWQDVWITHTCLTLKFYKHFIKRRSYVNNWTENPHVCHFCVMNKTRVYLVITYFTIFVKFVRLNCFFPPPAQIMITSASFKMVSIIFSNSIIYTTVLCSSMVVTLYSNIAIKEEGGKCPIFGHSV